MVVCEALPHSLLAGGVFGILGGEGVTEQTGAVLLGMGPGGIAWFWSKSRIILGIDTSDIISKLHFKLSKSRFRSSSFSVTFSVVLLFTAPWVGLL